MSTVGAFRSIQKIPLISEDWNRYDYNGIDFDKPS